MLMVFGFLLAGVLAGYLLRRFRVKWIGKVTMVLIWILLLLLGVEVGSNRQLIESLPTLGLEAAAVAVVSLVGSCLMAMLLWKCINRRERRKEGPGQ